MIQSLKKIKIKNIYILVSFLLLMISDLFNITALSFIDEFICIINILLIVFTLILHRKKSLCFQILFYLIILSCIGLLSNFVNSYQKNILYIFEDLFLFIKPYTYLMFAIDFVRKDNSNFFIKNISFVAKFMLIIIFVFGTINQIHNIGMTDFNGGYKFFAYFGGTMVYWVILLLSILMINRNKKFYFYWAISFFTILLTTSGLGKLGIILILLIYVFFNHKKINFLYFIPIIIVGFLISTNEITSYLLNNTSPRFILIQYGFITANNCFPLGSGFGTYASSIAANHYSELYQIYGFNYIWGLSKDYGAFLMDTYYPMIIAQIGYFGLVVFLLMLIYILNHYILNLTKCARNASIAMFIIWLIAGIGFGIGSTWGCAIFFCIGLIYKNVLITQGE